MAAARYWRINAIDTYGGGDLELSALHLYDESGRADLGAPLTSSHAPIAGALANLQDADDTSICRFGGAQVRSSGFFLQWDLGVGGASAPGLMFGAATDEEYFLAQCDLSYSNDGIFWTKEGELNRIIWPGSFSLTPVVKISDTAKVVLLLSCDGVHGAKNFIDSSEYTKTITAVGGVEISSTQSKFGGASAAFDGTTGYLSVPASPDFNFGTADFTIELWAWRANFPTAYAHFFSVGNQEDFTFKHWGATLYVYSTASGSLCFIADVFPPEVMCHLALVRTGNVFKVYVNGVQKATSSYAGAMGSGSLTVSIGRGSIEGVAFEYFRGYIDDLRITKGVARYTSDFTPPVSAFSATVEGTIVPLVRAAPPARALVAASAVVPTFSTRNAGRVATARDTEYGGPGTIYGTTKTNGTPNSPTKSRVVLLHQRSKQPVRETWSDPVTGAYAFAGIDTSQQFIVLAEDAAGSFRPVAANRLTPQVLP